MIFWNKYYICKQTIKMKNFKKTFTAITGAALTDLEADKLIEALRKDYEEQMNEALSDALVNEGTTVELYDLCLFPELFNELLPTVVSCETDKRDFNVSVDSDCLDFLVDIVNQDIEDDDNEQMLRENGHYN